MTNWKVKKIQQKITGNRLIFTLILVVLIATCIYLFVGYRQAKKKIVYLSTPEAQEEMKQKEVDELLKKVSKFIILPSDERPRVATIQDIENLVKDQPFFKNAQNGDKILFYKDRAIIYSPSANILINVGPVYSMKPGT